MIKINTYKMDGKKSGQIQLSETIFAVKINPSLVHQAIIRYLANNRAGTAHTKTRAEVRGGGRKPWRQKGTGNARVGSTRSPLWIGGGITFGPRKTRNWSKYLPKKMRRAALFMILTDKLTNKNLLILDKLTFSKIQTKQAEKFLHKMPIEEGSVLVLLPKSDMNVELSFQNLPYAKTLLVNSLNVYDVLKYDWLITDKSGLAEIEKIYLKKKDSKVSKVLKKSVKVKK